MQSKQVNPSWLQRQDLFGYQACHLFNIDRIQSKHKTTIGGVGSVFLKLCLFAFVVYNLILLFGTDKDHVRTTYVSTNYTAIGSIPYSDQGLHIFV